MVISTFKVLSTQSFSHIKREAKMDEYYLKSKCFIKFKVLHTLVYAEKKDDKAF